MPTHPATTVSHGDWVADVDVVLAPLVVEVWRAGIATIHSCQDVGENVADLATRLPHLDPVVRRERGRASIGFAGTGPLEAFLDALANAGRRDAFYERMVHWAAPEAWQLVIGVQDQGLRAEQDAEDDLEGQAPDGTPWSRLEAVSFQVRFPRSDVDEMTERMRRHNRAEVVALGRPTWATIAVDDDG